MAYKIATVCTDKAPAALGPYSQAIIYGELVFTSGQLGMDPDTGEFADGVEAQTHMAIKNLAQVLAAADSSLDQVLKTTVFLADIADFAKVNEVYATYFTSAPARSCVEVANIPKGGMIEIEAVAAVG